MSLSELTSLLTWVIGVAVIAAAGLAIFRANLAKSQIELLRGERDDANKKIDRLEKDRVEDAATMKGLQEKVRVLESVVTGKEQLNHLQEQLDAHDKRVDERHDTLLRRIDHVCDIIEHQHEDSQ